MAEALNKNVHLSGLNGLRAIAAMGVILAHITINLGAFNLDPFIFGKRLDGSPKGTLLASYGVTIFFTLSGFLITYLLVIEKEKKPINILHFYIRRILRIWPLYYIYMVVAVIALVCTGYSLKLISNTLPYYLFFAANIPAILDNALPLLRHYWSLGVEEQFYLFWPWIIKVTKKTKMITAAIIVILICIKLFLRYIIPGNDTSLIFRAMSDLRFQCMLIGAYGAMLFYDKHALFMKVSTSKAAQLFAWVIILLLAIDCFHIASILDHEFISVVTVLIIVGQSSVKNRIINLEAGIMDFTGRISYGIYMIHPLIIFGASKIFAHFIIPPAIKYPLIYVSVITVTILLAYCSFNFIEKWFLNLKSKYSAVISTDSKQ
jgi:peptidoglycan/LPS O-acetylase OafA/YrhL